MLEVELASSVSGSDEDVGMLVVVSVVCVLFIMRRLNVVSDESRLCFVYYGEAECCQWRESFVFCLL